MAAPAHNRCFKRPTTVPLHNRRPHTPPPPAIEPLSPAAPTPRPTPIEPNFNYPAINDQISFTVRPELAQAATPSRLRSYSTAHKNGHHRTPSSTIDDLANAALGKGSPYVGYPPRKSSVTFEASGHSHAHPRPHHHYPGSEPPHKRSRSEVLPSPHAGPYASRPATSYEPWSHSQPHHEYHSKVEEAALLLHLQSGGRAADRPQAPPPPEQSQARPHSHSFSQVLPPRAAMAPPIPLLPPFSPQYVRQPQSVPSPPRSSGQSRDIRRFEPARDDIEMLDASQAPLQPFSPVAANGTQMETASDEHRSREVSADVAMSESSDISKRRGWPKGKPRGSGSRKSLVEKITHKRKAVRKKGGDVKAISNGSPNQLRPELQQTRRASLADQQSFVEDRRKSTVAGRSPRASSVPIDTHMIIRDVPSSKPAKKKSNLKADTECTVCQSAKVRTRQGELDEWICCNGCKKWSHFDCAGFKKAHEVRDVDKYFCAVCEPTHGKTTHVRKSTRAHASVDYAELQRGILKTSEESVEHHYIQPIKDGTFQFDPEMFPRMKPEMVTRDFFEKSGAFVEPICIPAGWNPRPWEERREHVNDQVNGYSAGNDAPATISPNEFEYEPQSDNGQDRLEMIMPEGLTVRQVCHLVGPEWPIDVIDVKTQNSGAKWNLSRWADYYEEESSEKAIRNVISLEVSQTKLGRLLQRPKVVRDIDLQDDVWPQEEIDKGKFPKVQFYCLMSVADSYTDFHIDFGGSSVYYHILKGKKTFFFIPPKQKHLKAYEEWNDSPQQNYTFLPSITKECYRVDLSEGDTMLIPSGWIHAVWTPEDSLVIGGNFLNRLSYRNQFKVVDIEKANETPIKFRYPFFQKIMWYTAIKYLMDDPLPREVSDLLHSGVRYQRDVPVWSDFDGELAKTDPRPGAKNARYYSQAEIEGLPDLVNYIFRTVMIVMGRVEGFSQDRIKRINASIPKGHGEPLELAKTFALWCAWKRGNEDPPNWAHPDAVLPNSKDEGQPKKLSERKLKELEKKEAIAAWRVAPDRQSARVMQKAAQAEATAAAAANATSHPETTFASASRTSQPPDIHQYRGEDYQMLAPEHQYASMAAPHAASPAAFMMPGAHFSTPKTSVLGPKRVACDTCRKRRIRCKHKDLVTEANISPPNGFGHLDFAHPGLAPELHDNITVAPVRPRAEQSTFESAGLNEEQGQPNGSINGQTFPGTNAYVNANIPMAVNGVPIFGDAPKRGRTKACYECRKSKVGVVCQGSDGSKLTERQRRCIHDENGNVDAAKAAEPPVPRGSAPNKKRENGEDGSPMPAKKARQASSPNSQAQPRPVEMQQHGTPFGQLRPQPISYQPRSQQQQRPPEPSLRQPQQTAQPPPPPQQQQHQNQIDPNLFSLYTQDQDVQFHDHHYPYPGTDQPQPYHQRPQSSGYNIPSLEQIANEVLVDMSGPEPHDGQTALERNLHLFQNADTAPMANGYPPKPDESVDSAISLPTTEVPKPNGMPNGLANVHYDETAAEGSAPQPSIEPAEPKSAPPPPQHDARPQSSTSKSGVEALPLYQPPAPVSLSPEVTKRQPALTNGAAHASPPAETNGIKRKRDSTSATPGAKKAKLNLVGGAENAIAEDGDKESLELARMLQQEDRGLRRRSRTEMV